MGKKLSYGGIAVLVILSLLILSCSKKSTTSNNTTAITIQTLTAAPSSIQKNQVSVIEVVVVNSQGQPVSGALVTFNVTPSSLGNFDRSADTTDVTGTAGAIFTAANDGIALITAQVNGSGTKNTQITIQTSATIPEDQIEIKANPTILPANGIAQAVITATVRDSIGNLVADGSVVKFVAGEKFDDVDGDGYFTENIDQLTYDGNANGRWDPIGWISPTGTTDSGVATVNYTAGKRVGTVYIKATFGKAGQQIQNETSIYLTPADTVTSISIITDAPSIQVKQTGGIEFTHLTAVCYDHNGNRVGGGFPVIFQIMTSPGGGENLDGRGLGPDTVLTSSFGEATVTLNAGTISGTVRIRALSGTILSQSALVSICAGPPSHISLGANPLNIRGWDVVNATSQITCLVNDRYGNPVPDKTAIYFSTDEGTVDSHGETVGGLTSVSYHSGEPRGDGLARIYAETYGGTVRDSSSFFIIVSGPPAEINFLTYPASLLATTSSKGEVVVEVLDVNGNFVVTGTQVEMKTQFGTINSGTTTDGIHASIFATELVAASLDQDYSPVSPDDGIGANVRVTARSGWVSNFVTVQYLTGYAYSDNCAVKGNTTVTYGSTTYLTAVIRDRFSNPLGGHSITANATGGTISGVPKITNSYGEAAGIIFTATADTTVKTANVNVLDQDPRGGVTMSVKVTLSK
jgi:hypothetical protein